MDIDIRQTWIDPRLRWKDVPVKDIKVKGMKYIILPIMLSHKQIFCCRRRRIRQEHLGT